MKVKGFDGLVGFDQPLYVLVYGNDFGKVDFCLKKIFSLVGGDFLVRVDYDDFIRDSSYILGKASNCQLFRSKEVIVFYGMGVELHAKFRSYVDDFLLGSYVIFVATDVPVSSNLIQHFIKSDRLFAMQCYSGTDAMLRCMVREYLRGANFDSDVESYLCDIFSVDSACLFSSIQKLLLCFGDQKISVDSVALCLGDEVMCQPRLEQLFDCFLECNAKDFLTLLDYLILHKVNVISIIRFILGHLDKLYVLAIEKERGCVDPVEKLLPNLFFKRKEKFKYYLGRFGKDRILDLLVSLVRLETFCRNNSDFLVVLFRHKMILIMYSGSKLVQ